MITYITKIISYFLSYLGLNSYLSYGIIISLPFLWYSIGLIKKDKIRKTMFEIGLMISQKCKKMSFWDKYIEPAFVKQFSILFSACNALLEGMVSDNQDKTKVTQDLEDMRDAIRNDLDTFEKLYSDDEKNDLLDEFNHFLFKNRDKSFKSDINKSNENMTELKKEIHNQLMKEILDKTKNFDNKIQEFEQKELELDQNDNFETELEEELDSINDKNKNEDLDNNYDENFERELEEELNGIKDDDLNTNNDENFEEEINEELSKFEDDLKESFKSDNSNDIEDLKEPPKSDNSADIEDLKEPSKNKSNDLEYSNETNGSTIEKIRNMTSLEDDGNIDNNRTDGKDEENRENDDEKKNKIVIKVGRRRVRSRKRKKN